MVCVCVYIYIKVSSICVYDKKKFFSYGVHGTNDKS